VRRRPAIAHPPEATRYDATLIAALTLLCPIMAIGLGVIATGDQMDARMVVGAGAALTGVLIIVLKPPQLVQLFRPARR
jgi:drug/metabolite transporter (DMT)-like permease